MIKIDDENRIYITRGDTGYLNIEINDSYVAHEGDYLTFTVRREWDDPVKLIELKGEPNKALVIEPAHTNDLKPGCYIYDIQLTTSLGEIYTVITPALFFIAEEVSYE